MSLKFLILIDSPLQPFVFIKLSLKTGGSFMVKLVNLHKTYTTDGVSVEALRGIDLTIEKGCIFGIIGTSGAGKSSLVRCINLLEKPEKGQVIVDGIDLTLSKKKGLREARKKIGMIFQHFNLLMNGTVYDNIAFPLIISKKPKDFIRRKVMEMLELVGLEDKKDMYPSMLSGGQKQRVGIARALVSEPNVLMCDEATSSLDPTTTKSILELLKTINKKLNLTIILITHEMEVIKSICDKVAIIESGRIVEQGEVLTVVINPKTKIAKEFFDILNEDIDNDTFKKAVNSEGTILKAIFLGEKVTEPFMSTITNKFNVEASILFGNIQQINETLVGSLIVKIHGTNENIENTIKYLTDSKIKIEVVTYE
jgi:D-methionine transport system ATP-binding protein